MNDFLNLGTPALWALAVGFFSPPVISLILQSRWSPRKKALVAFVFYLVVAAVTAYVQGLFNTADYIRLALLVFLLAVASYKAVWHPTGIAPAIETKSNLTLYPAEEDDTPKHAA